MLKKFLIPLIRVWVIICLASGVAYAHRSPSNCSGGGLGMQLLKFQLSGAFANTITNGQAVIFSVMLYNDAQTPTPEGSIPTCDVTGTLVVKAPDRQGNPTVTVLTTNLNIPFGTPPFSISVTSLVDVASDVTVVRGAALVTGVLHDVDIPGCTPDGTSVTNECDPTPVLVDRSTSFIIRRPAMNIYAQCLSATNTGDAVLFELAGSVTNSGDESLVNVSILRDGPGGATVVTNISHLPVGASVNFYQSAIATNYVNPTLSNRVVSTGVGLGTLASMNAQDACSIPVAARFGVRSPRRRPDGSMELVVDCPRGWNYSIQASTNCLDWVTLSSNIGTLSATSYVDVDAPSFPCRFYRAKASGL